MRYLIYVAVAGAVAASPAQSKQCDAWFKFDRGIMYSVEEISHLAAERETRANKNGSLIVNYFDDGYLPRKNGWEAVLIFYASSGDIGSNTIGGTLLARGKSEFNKVESERLSRTRGGINVVLSPISNTACTDGNGVITFDDGGNLSFNKTQIGNVSD